MQRATTSTRRWLQAFLLPWLIDLIRRILGSGPVIDGFSPTSGWGGTIVRITGSRFGVTRDENAVVVGGHPALVLTASVTELRVVTHQATTTGPVVVTVAAGTDTTPGDFVVLGPVDQSEVASSGQPQTFVGPQRGTPTARGLHQKVLGILTFPTDHDPGDPGQRATKKADQVSRFADADRFYQEASFGATSFDFDVTDWLSLPRDRLFYMWQQEDVVAARRNLYRSTRLGLGLNGTRADLAHWQGFAAIDAGNPASPTLIGTNALAPPGPATAVAEGPAHTYVGFGTTGVKVLDVQPIGDPDEVETLPSSGWVADLAIAGTTLVIAAEEQGLRLVDTTNPTTVHDMATPGWAMGVAVSGSHVLVAAGGSGLVVVDVSTPLSPAQVGALDLGAWALAVVVSNGHAYVATDGDGVKVVDISTPASPTLVSTDRSVLHVFGVAADGGTHLYLAGADQGLHVLDVHDPTATSDVGHLDLNPALAVAVSGTVAYVAVGPGTLQTVGIADPAHPSATGSYTAVSGVTVPLQSLRDKLNVAIGSQDELKRGDAFLAHAFQAAQAAGYDFTHYEGFIVIAYGPFLRGASWTAPALTPYGGYSLSFNTTKGLVYMADGGTWGRRSHEMGHWLGLPDVYQDYYPDGTYVLGSAAEWDMMGKHDEGPLFSGHHLDFLGYYDPAKIAERTWTLGAPALDETVELVAHDRAEDAGIRFHLLKLNAAEGLIYYVEVRQRPGGPNPVIFDANVPVPNDAGHPWEGGVIVTKALVNNNHANEQERSVTWLDQRVLQPGDEVIDAARQLRLTVVDKSADRPLAYHIRLEWNQPVADDPAGTFDLSIAPWTTDTYTSIDVWVDSPRNNPSPTTAVYEFHQDNPPDNTIPRLVGDRPWVHHENNIYARIHNTGVSDARDVYVSFYTTTPPGIGDNGSWVLRETKHVDTVAHNSDVRLTSVWIPSVGEHTCIKVDIATQIGEVSVGNNRAQENVAIFDSAGASSHEPVEFLAMVRNPFPAWRLVLVQVRGLPAGWYCVVDHAWLWVPPSSERPLDVVIWTIKDTAAERHQELKVDPLALPRIEGWTNQMHRIRRIGGTTVAVHANRKVAVEWRAGHRKAVHGKPMEISGCLIPPLPDVGVVVEVTDPTGSTVVVSGVTGANGCFTVRYPSDTGSPSRSGRYRVIISTVGGPVAAETTSAPGYVDWLP